MSSKTSVFYCQTKEYESIHIYHEGNSGQFRLEVDSDTFNTYGSVNIQISPELKDIFILAATAYPKDV